MKNIYVLPTDKPSILYAKDDNYKLANSTMAMDWYISSAGYKPHNIYITSDEEIKEDYVFAYGVIIKVMIFDVETLYFVNGTKAKREDCKKIILTTDQDLIADGVQAIDDEFLEWFVKNPSCEYVRIEHERILWESGKITHYKYKIIIPRTPQQIIDEDYASGLEMGQIIPQEEPKQIKCYCGHTTYCDCCPLEEPEQSVKDRIFPETSEKTKQKAREYGNSLVTKELKQETLEEAAWQYAKEKLGRIIPVYKELNANVAEYVGFIEGAKWQAEKMYSEEEVKVLLHKFMQSEKPNWHGYSTEKWFEQHKK